MSETLIRAAAAVIHAASATVAAFFAVRALFQAARRHAERARLLMADGVIAALGFSLAASLLKTIGLGTWHQIGMFAFVLGVRTAMKFVFAAERRRPIITIGKAPER
jgi:uncharacterized membrane protein